MSVLEQSVDAGVRPIPEHAPGVVSACNLIKRYGRATHMSTRCAVSRSRSRRAA
jgi:hypothetical protein